MWPAFLQRAPWPMKSKTKETVCCPVENACLCFKEKRYGTNLGHDLGVWLSNRVGPLHSDRVPPHLHFAAHQAAASLRCRLVIFVLQETEAAVLLLVIRLVVQYDLLETLCEIDNNISNFQNSCPVYNPKLIYFKRSYWQKYPSLLWDWPVTLPKSSNILSLVLFFGIDPTNRRLFATDIQTPKYLPGRISWLSHWKWNHVKLIINEHQL